MNSTHAIGWFFCGANAVAAYWGALKGEWVWAAANGVMFVLLACALWRKILP